MPQKPLKPHIIEINALKSLDSQIHNWLSLYRKLQEKEEEYYTIVLNSKGEMKDHYSKKMKLISKRLDQLGKRLNFNHLISLLENIQKRLSILYEYDRLLQTGKVD